MERYKLFIKKAKYDLAAQELNRIFEIFPKYPNLHFYKGALYSSSGDHKAAADEYAEELKTSPNSITVLIALGNEYLETGNPDGALTQFTKAISLAPNLAEPRGLAGYANYLLKNYNGAVGLLKSAIIYDPGNPTLYKRLGMVYRAMNDLPNAKEQFQKYLEMEPDATDRSEFERFIQ